MKPVAAAAGWGWLRLKYPSEWWPMAPWALARWAIARRAIASRGPPRERRGPLESDSDPEPRPSPPPAEGKAILSQNLASRVPHSVQMLAPWRGSRMLSHDRFRTPPLLRTDTTQWHTTGQLRTAMDALVLHFSRWRSLERGFLKRAAKSLRAPRFRGVSRAFGAGHRAPIARPARGRRCGRRIISSAWPAVRCPVPRYR
jgi:hypothetical protein